MPLVALNVRLPLFVVINPEEDVVFVLVASCAIVEIWFPAVSVRLRPDVAKLRVSPPIARLMLLVALSVIFALALNFSRYLVVKAV